MSARLTACDWPRVGEAVEDLAVEQFVAELAVEALAVAVERVHRVEPTFHEDRLGFPREKTSMPQSIWNFLPS